MNGKPPNSAVSDGKRGEGMKESEWDYYQRLIGKEAALSHAMVQLTQSINEVCAELTRVYNESQHPEIVRLRSWKEKNDGN